MRRNPELPVLGRLAHELHLEESHEVGIDVEVGDVPCESRGGIERIPFARNLLRVLEVEHRIEDRLLRQARGKGSRVAVEDQIQLEEPDGPVERAPRI